MARKKNKRSLKKTAQRNIKSPLNIAKISDLLGSPKKLKKTVLKGVEYNDSPFKGRRQDPLEQKRLHERSIRMQSLRRDIMLRQVAERQRRLTQQQNAFEGLQNKLVSKKLDVCSKRGNKRVALFASRQIGKGKGSGKTRKYTENSKIKC